MGHRRGRGPAPSLPSRPCRPPPPTRRPGLPPPPRPSPGRPSCWPPRSAPSHCVKEGGSAPLPPFPTAAVPLFALAFLGCCARANREGYVGKKDTASNVDCGTSVGRARQRREEGKKTILNDSGAMGRQWKNTDPPSDGGSVSVDDGDGAVAARSGHEAHRSRARGPRGHSVHKGGVEHLRRRAVASRTLRSRFTLRCRHP